MLRRSHFRRKLSPSIITLTGPSSANSTSRTAAREASVWSNVRPIEKRGEISQQAEPADRSPADIFDQPVGRIRVRRDHHVAAGELGVAEREKQTAAPVEFRRVVRAKRKSPAIQARQTCQHAERIAGVAESLEMPVGKLRGVGGETEASAD